jgi:metal-dependent hydrolase (beta-lactamase superfamily II)
MIDTAEEPFIDHVIDSIRTLGFSLKDIKYILIRHGYLDHFGGANPRSIGRACRRDRVSQKDLQEAQRVPDWKRRQSSGQRFC